MPKPHRNTYVFQRKSPRQRIDLRVRHDPFSRPTPGATLAFKDSFERSRIAQAFCIAWSQHQHFQKRSEEHTSELQSQSNLVCRLLLEKKKNTRPYTTITSPLHTHSSHASN